MNKKELISIVVACYNEEEVLPIFYDEINKVSKDYKKPSDKVISEFNKKIWDIIKEPREEKERLIVPQKNDMYIINLQLYRRFSSTAQMNPELQNNMVVNMNLKRQIDLITKNYQSCTNGKTS